MEPSSFGRRSSSRVPYGAWIEDLTQGGHLKFYLAKNLSLGGLLLQADTPPPLGSKVRLRLVVENEKETMTMEGQVIRHSTERGGKRFFAVKFMHLDHVRLRFLEDIIKDFPQESDEVITSDSDLEDL